MHEKGFIHGDLKPLNIMRSAAKMKLIDLDSACEHRSGIISTPIITLSSYHQHIYHPIITLSLLCHQHTYHYSIILSSYHYSINDLYNACEHRSGISAPLSLLYHHHTLSLLHRHTLSLLYHQHTCPYS